MSSALPYSHLIGIKFLHYFSKVHSRLTKDVHKTTSSYMIRKPSLVFSSSVSGCVYISPVFTLQSLASVYSRNSAVFSPS